MARRSFEMYEIRQIIVCLRSGETIRGIAQTKLANRKKIRAVRKTAVQKKVRVESSVKYVKNNNDCHVMYLAVTYGSCFLTALT